MKSLDALIGREDSLSELASLVDSSRLVTVTGSAGIGKTRIATEFASRTAAEWTFVRLEHARTHDDVLRSLGEALGMPLEDGAQFGRALCAHGTVRRLLIDNVEQVVDSIASMLTNALATAPALRCLVTSRERLRITGEQVMSLAPLSRTDAVRLFHARARERQSDYDGESASAAAVVGVVERLDRVPLAIELAAAQTTLFSPGELLDRLGADLSVLRTDRRSVPARQATLDGAIEWSWRLLGEEERRSLALLSVFEAPFPVRAAEEVLSEVGVDATRLLHRLIDRSLLKTIVIERTDGKRWLQNYAAVRDFARRHLTSSDETLAIARTVNDLLSSEVNDRCLTEVSPRVRDLMNRVARAIGAGEHEPAVRGVVLLGRLARLKGPVRPVLELANEALLAMRGSSHDEHRVTLQRTRALLRMRIGEHAGAEVDLSEALLGVDTATEAELLVELGTVQRRRGRVDEAEASYRRAREEGAPKVRQGALSGLAGLLHEQGRLDEAHEAHVAALALSERLGDELHVGVALQNFGLLLQEQGDLEAAEQRFVAAQKIHQRLDHTRFEGVARCDLGCLALLKGAPRAAAEGFASGVELLEGVGDVRETLVAQALRAASDAICGELGRAAHTFTQVSSMTAAMGFEDLELAVRLHEGHLWLSRGRAALRQGARGALEDAVARVTELLAQNRDTPPSDEARFARRILRSALSAHRDPEATLRASPDAVWVVPPGGASIDLSRKETLRRLLAVLLDLRLRRPEGGLDTGALLAAGWADEHVLPEAAKNRVQVGLSQLRKLGLGALLLRDPKRGYRLDETVDVLVC